MTGKKFPHDLILAGHPWPAARLRRLRTSCPSLASESGRAGTSSPSFSLHAEVGAGKDKRP